jgi:hypothetical protein
MISLQPAQNLRRRCLKVSEQLQQGIAHLVLQNNKRIFHLPASSGFDKEMLENM